MKLLDSNFIFGYIVENDSLHEDCLCVGKELKREECIVLSDVLHEVVSITAVRHSSELAIEIGDKILRNFNIYSPKPDQRKAIWETFQMLSPHRLSYVDVALYYFVKSHKYEVVTFDKKLKSLCKKINY